MPLAIFAVAASRAFRGRLPQRLKILRPTILTVSVILTASTQAHVGGHKLTEAADRELLQDVLEGLFDIAKADNVLQPRELEFLRQVAKRFGIATSRFRHEIVTKRNPYDVLGVQASIGNDELSANDPKRTFNAHCTV